ncbi:hypothetical protein SAMN05216436_11765 [bacterium A37T11]|nr:hypothetical protein SAMN05216436_11765 [bacterium A37T11]
MIFGTIFAKSLLIKSFDKQLSSINFSQDFVVRRKEIS